MLGRCSDQLGFIVQDKAGGYGGSRLSFSAPKDYFLEKKKKEIMLRLELARHEKREIIINTSIRTL